jgi:hypothetical protein
MKVLILMTLSCLMFSAWVDCQLADLTGLIDLKKRSLGGLVGGLEGLEGSALSLKKRSYEDDAAINLDILKVLKKRNAQGDIDWIYKRSAQGDNDWMYSTKKREAQGDLDWMHSMKKREAQKDWMEPWMG